MRKALAIAALGAAAALVAAPRTVRADDAGDLEALLDEPLVAAASKSQEAVSAAPASTTIVSADDLRRYGVRSLDEAINFLSAGMVAETPLTATEVGARGVTITQDYGAHVLVLIDGHALNEAWGGTAYFDRAAGIPLEIVDHIELIVGPGSVLYGSNAMLGVISVVTKRAKDYKGLHGVVESELIPGPVGGPGWSMRGAAGGGFEFEVLKTRGEVTFIGEYYSLRGPELRFGPQSTEPDGVTGEPRRWSGQTPPGVWGGIASQSYFARIPTGYFRFSLGDFTLTARAELYRRSYPYHPSDFDDPGTTERDRWLSLDASYKRSIGSQVQIGARLYGDLYDYLQLIPSTAPGDCLPGQDAGCRYDLYGRARWAGLELSGSFDWTGASRLVTLVGADGRVKNVGSTLSFDDPTTQKPFGTSNVSDVTEVALGVYVQQTLRPVDWLSFNTGARVDVDQRYGASLNPRAAVNVSPWKGGVVKAIYAKAFRAPTAFERYYVDPTSQIPPVALKPESVRSVEGSFEQRFGTHAFEVGVFKSEWEDLVLNQNLTQGEIDAAVASGQLVPGVTLAQQTRNAAQIDSYGFTGRVEGSAVSGRLRYGASVTRARSRRHEDGTPDPIELGAAAQVFGNARISYDLSDGKKPFPVVGLATRFVGKRPSNITDANGNYTRAPAQVELRATVSGPFPKLRGLSYRVSGGYVFGPRYAYAVGPAYNADGTNQLAPVDQVKIALGLSYDLAL
jgi:outer membrane receptor protein involved in Fe transport